MNSKDTITDDCHDKGDEANHHKGGIGVLLRYIAVGTIILWFLGVSTNGVFNFFSDVPGFQLYPFFISACAGIWYLAFHIALRLKNVPWIFMVGSIVCCIFLVITSKQEERKIAQIDAANELQIEPKDHTVDPQDPFESSFTVQNPSHTTSVYHLFYSCWWNDPGSEGKYTVIGTAFTDEIIELGPMQKADLKIRNLVGIKSHLSDKTSFHIDVRYMREGRQYTNRFRFRITNGKNGTFAWDRTGKGEDMQAFYQGLRTNVPPPHDFWDVAPYIKVAVKSLKRLPEEYGKQPSYEFVYTFHNGGIVEVKHIQWEWSVYASDGKGVFSSGVQKATNGIASEELVPGADATIDDTVTELDPTVYDGIISNNCVLEGEVLCVSPGGIQWLQYFVIDHLPKNDVWRTRTYHMTSNVGLYWTGVRE